MSKTIETTSGKGYNDPKTFAAMRTPHENDEAARIAYNAFIDDLDEIRKKHRIADVHVIVGVNYVAKDDVVEPTSARALVSIHLGNSLEAVGMCAFAYGREKALLEQKLSEALAGRMKDHI